MLYRIGGSRYHYRGLAGFVCAGMVSARIAFLIGFHGMLEFRWREWVGKAFLKPRAAEMPPRAVFGIWPA